MGLGSTAKKLQSLADTAEDLYARLNDLRDDVGDLRTAVEETSEQVDRLEAETAAQRALLEALADEQGVDVASVLEEADATGEADAAGDGEVDAAADSEADAADGEADAAADGDD